VLTDLTLGFPRVVFELNVHGAADCFVHRVSGAKSTVRDQCFTKSPVAVAGTGYVWQTRALNPGCGLPCRWDGRVIVWDGATGRSLGTIVAGSFFAPIVAVFLDDGHTVATADGAVQCPQRHSGHVLR
jgi:hypothetical protein